MLLWLAVPSRSAPEFVNPFIEAHCIECHDSDTLTVCDLLHIMCDLKGLFPEDVVTVGFDKVGEGLTLSATHFARYQEAAEKALADAIFHAAGLHYSKDGEAYFKGNEKTFTNYGNWVEDDCFVPN